MREIGPINAAAPEFPLAATAILRAAIEGRAHGGERLHVDVGRAKRRTLPRDARRRTDSRARRWTRCVEEMRSQGFRIYFGAGNNALRSVADEVRISIMKAWNSGSFRIGSRFLSRSKRE